jgi:calcium-dependent protein kinase
VLNYLHSHGVVHRDVKLENLIFDREGSEHLKLIDFGFSAKWSPVSDTNMDEIAGTLHYMAPEVLSGKDYTSQCDLWSLGVIAFTLLSGTMPFLGSQFKMINSIRNGAYSMQPRVWNDISDEAKSFIKSLINTNPTQRLSAKAALEHPWIRQAQRKVPLDIVEVLETLRDFGGASKFRRNCLQMLALFLPNEDQAKVRDQFLWLAGYEHGAITMEKLSEAISEQFKVVGEGEALQIFRAFGLEQNQEMQFSDFLVAMLGERIQLNGNFVASVFYNFGQQNRGSISREELLAIFDSEELEDRFVETELQNSDGQVNVTDLVAYSLDNSWKRANLVQKKHNMMSLRNMFSAWKESKLAKESSFEQQRDVVESNILDVAHNSEKHAELVSTCRSMLMSPQFTSTFKKHIAIRREIGKLAKESITEQQHDMVESNRHDVAHNSENHAELMSTFRSMLMSAEFASTFKRHVALSKIRREISFLGW